MEISQLILPRKKDGFMAIILMIAHNSAACKLLINIFHLVYHVHILCSTLMFYVKKNYCNIYQI